MVKNRTPSRTKPHAVKHDPPGARTAATLDDKFEELVNRKLKEYHVTGISCAMVEGEDVEAKGYGYAQLPSKPATASTQYYIGSITKGFLAATWLKWLASSANQERSRKLSLQTKLADIVWDDFVLQNSWSTTHITLEDAMCHRTGMSRHDSSYGGDLNDVKAVTRNLRNLPLSNEPRYKFEYCNMMFVAATHALETAAGRPAPQMIKELVFDPVGMGDTYCSRKKALNHAHGDVRLFDGYTWLGKPESDGQGEFERQEHLDFGPVGGAGFIISNVLDMAKYLKNQLGHGDALSKEVKEELLRPRVQDSKNEYADGYSHYALGYSREFYRGVEIISHNGGLNGYTSLMAWIPSEDWGFVSLGNADNAVFVHEILLHHLVDNMLGVKLEDRFDFDAKYGPLETEYLHYSLELPFQKSIRDSVNRDPDAAKRLYPEAPSPGLHPALPLAQYAGTYHNAGYRSMTFELVSGKQGANASTETYLLAKIFDRVWKHIIELYHVSGEYWAGYRTRGQDLREGRQVENLHAVFRVGANGKVESLGLEVELDLGGDSWEESLIWFDRV